MKNSKWCLIMGAMFLFFPAGLLTGCGGGGGSGQSPPAIQNLRFSPNSTTFYNLSSSIITVNVSVDYNVSGSDLSKFTFTTYDTSGNHVTSVTGPIGGVKGKQSGTLSVNGSIDTTKAGNFTFKFYVIDTDGHNSNILSGTFNVQDYPWKLKSHLPQLSGFGEIAMAAADGGIYTIASEPMSISSIVMLYDPGTDTWSTKAPMPATAIGLGVINGNIYALGRTSSGISGISLLLYDSATDTWTPKAPLPPGQFPAATVAVNGKLYAISGFDSTDFNLAVNTVEEYDPATDTWTTKSPIPTARVGIAAAAVNGMLYVIGGTVLQLHGSGSTVALVEKYDPATDTWTTSAPMPTGRLGLTAQAVNGKLYAIGGVVVLTTDIFYATNVVEQYDPITNSWTTKTPMPTWAWQSVVEGSAVVDNKIYVTDIGDTPRLEQYDPSMDP